MKRKYTAISQTDPLTEPPPPPPPPPPLMVAPPPENDNDYYYDDGLVPQPPDWFTRLVLLQADMIYNSMSILFSPISSLFHLATDSYHRAEEARDRVQSTVQKAPSSLTHGSVLLFKKLGMGFLGVAYVCMVMIAVMVASVVLGVGLVRFWVEEPVLVRERLHFDYTDLHPKATFSLCGVRGLDFRGSGRFVFGKDRHVGGIPVGHTFQVSVLMLMPDSDYNRFIGVFQLTAELLTATGQVIARSSQPCMLRFRSLPVRLTRTFLLGVPLLLGISTETQKVKVNILKHKEISVPRTDAVRVSLIPRAGTLSPPQLYEAEILINSQLPWPKKLVHNWKWTFYVWVSLYTYTMLLLVLLCCCRPLVLSGPVHYVPVQRSFRDRLTEGEVDEGREEGRRGEADKGRERDVSELLRKLRESRRRRRALLMAADVAAGSSGSNMTVSREETETTAIGPGEEYTGDSESEC